MNDQTESETVRNFDKEISEHLNTIGDELREVADMVDKDDGDLSEILDDIASDIKGHLAAKAANSQTSDEAEDADEIIEVVEDWVTSNISNSTTDRRVAAAYAFLGREEARKKLGLDTNSWRLTIDEIQHHRRIYTVEAATREEAIAKAERGETISEEDLRFVSVVSRDNAEVIED